MVIAPPLLARTTMNRAADAPRPAFTARQGHSILITSGSPICQDTVDVHGVAPKGIGDVVDLVEPQDVEGEIAQDGEGDRALADAAGILVHGDVEHVVDAVLHAPVASGRGGIICGTVAVLGPGCVKTVPGDWPDLGAAVRLDRREVGLEKGMDGIARPNHRIETMLADILT